MRINNVVVLLTGLNIALLSMLIYMHVSSTQKKALLDDIIKIRNQYNYDDLLPNIVYSKDDKADVIFRPVNDEKNRKLSNCINPDVQGVIKRTEALTACLPLFKEYKPNSKKENRQLLKDVPNFVPKFGEAAAIVDYPYNKVKWRDLYNSQLGKENVLNRLGHYQNKVPTGSYDYDPQKGPDFEEPHMGIFNMDDYCNVHDILIQANPSLALTKKYFVTDYHQLSLPRMFIMNEMGKDLMPKISKNMPALNFYQKLYPIDYRANMFFFKRATFHNHHEIGRNFACWGQSYNHIPGHGGIVRKDLLTKYSSIWYQKLKNSEKCKAQLNYFPEGFRLYITNECQTFFKIINSKKYEQNKKHTPIQYMIKAGYGVHRGVGVEILDLGLEKKLREQYDNGAKCGEINQNLIAQKYIADPVLYKGHKFDFRMYMLVSSVNPLKIYYHDGFLRVSLEKYDKTSLQENMHKTNTELSKKIIKDCELHGKKHNNMACDEMRDFQMQTLEELADYLYKTGQVKDPNWLDNYLRPEFKRSYLAAAKMIEERYYKSSDVFEMYGVDLIMDKDFRLYIIEVNASPMVVGTSTKKTALMKNMLSGLFNIIFAQQFSRTNRTLDFINEKKEKIMKTSKLQSYKDEFNRLYQNYIQPEYQHMIDQNPWEVLYDGTKEGKYEKYLGLIDNECVDLIE